MEQPGRDPDVARCYLEGVSTVRDRILELRSAINQAAAGCGARHIRIFGSVARGEEHDESDVDFIVNLDPGRTLLDLARLEVALERLLGRRVDVMAETELPEAVRSVAQREAINV